jgi:hypothetical protein
MRRIALDTGEVARRYLGGASEYGLASRYGVSRAVIRRHLEAAEIPIRGRSAAGRVRARKMTPDERKAQAAAANEVWRNWSGPRPRAPESTPIAERFWSKVDKSGDCWVWTGSRARGRWQGYGRINAGDFVALAHRVSWEIANGPIPTGMLVLHRCDNPPCVRPEHLFLGTSHDNNLDMARKRRSTHGERNAGAKLTKAMVRAMRAEREAGESVSALAGKYGVSPDSASRILNRRTWKHV